jgi:hypothetical protein
VEKVLISNGFGGVDEACLEKELEVERVKEGIEAEDERGGK